MVWANFGYYLAEGKWIDPESEGELYEAYMNQPSFHGAEPHLQTSQDPEIMDLAS
jgi:hypothetical protein